MIRGVPSNKPATGLRILVVFSSIPYWGNERSQIAAMDLMQKIGADVHFILNEEYGHESIEPEVKRIGCPYSKALFGPRPQLKPSVSFWADQSFRYQKTHAQISKAIDAFHPTHLHITSSTDLYWAARAAERTGLPVTLKVPTAVPPDARWWVHYLWKNVIPKYVHQFSVTSGFMVKHLNDFEIPSSRICKIPNFLFDRPEPKQNPPCDNWPSDRRRILFIGQVSTHKGVDSLLEAGRNIVSKFDDVDVLIAGDYQWKNPFAAKAIEDLKNENLQDRIIFLGQIDWVLQALQKSHVHVLPSKFEEPFGNVILEAKSAGIPSIVSPRGGMPELVEHGVAGFVCGDATGPALEAELIKYLSNEDLRIEHGKAALKSLEEYAPERIALQWYELFRKAAE